MRTVNRSLRSPQRNLPGHRLSDEIEVPGTIAHHPVDPIIDAEILPDPSMPSMETSAKSDAVQPILQEQPAKLLDLAEKSTLED